MRVPDKSELKGLELFKYLKENKESIIAEKKSLAIKSDSLSVNTSLSFFKDGLQTKEMDSPEMDPTTLLVKVVANTSNFCDSHYDVLAPDCWKKTIRENGPRGKNIIAHICDHKHEITAKVGKVEAIYSEDLELRKIGVKSDIKEAQALIFETEIRKDFNEKVYNLYKAGEVNQHSIGLQYVKIDLAVNSEDDEYKQEYKLWRKQIDNIVNKEEVIERGYFWYVTEIKLYENSAVLFGSNEITPTLETLSNEPDNTTRNNSDEEPDNTTLDEQNKQSNNLKFQNFI